MLNRRLIVAWSVAGLLMGSATVLAQASQPSLAEVARKEAERRKAVTKASKVYTDEDTKAGGRLLTTAAARPAAPQAATDKGDSAGTKEDPRVAALGGEVLALRASELRNQIGQKEQAGARMKAQILQVEGLIGNAFDENQRTALVADRDARVTSLQQLESEIEALQQQISQLEAAARRAVAPAPAAPAQAPTSAPTRDKP